MIANSPSIWRRLYIQDFQTAPPPPESSLSSRYISHGSSRFKEFFTSSSALFRQEHPREVYLQRYRSRVIKVKHFRSVVR